MKKTPSLPDGKPSAPCKRDFNPTNDMFPAPLVPGDSKTLAALKGEQNRFMAWVAAQRADRLKGIGLENLWSQADIDVMKTLNQGAMKDGTPRPMIYAQALRDLNDFNDSMLDVAVGSGLIDEATRQMYRDNPYVPFYRTQDDGDAKFAGKAGLVNQEAWKRLKGGTDKLNGDLMANLLLNWAHLIDASAKNRAAKATLDAAARSGIATDMTNDVTAFDQNGKVIYKGNTKGLVSYKGDIVRNIPAGQAYEENGVSKVSDGTARIRYVGDRYFKVDDPLFLDAVTALEYAGLGAWAKPFAVTKHWLTAHCTQLATALKQEREECRKARRVHPPPHLFFRGLSVRSTTPIKMLATPRP